MAAQQYALLGLGNLVGQGVTDARHATLKAVVKSNDDCGYIISNEYICSEIGRWLGLPIPPSGLVYSPGSATEHWFAQLNFNLTGDTLPVVDEQLCVKKLPALSTGLVLFDILIANSDRHQNNFAVDFTAKPPRMSVFDHSHALFGIDYPNGALRLAKLRDRIGASGGSATCGNRQCLLDYLDDPKLFEDWYLRIEGLPDYLLKDACDATVSLGMITQADADAAFDFLKYRRRNIRELVKNYRSEFSAIQQWPLI